MTFFLIQCDATGNPVTPIESMSKAISENCIASAELYKRVGFQVPWVSYVAINDKGAAVKILVSRFASAAAVTNFGC